MPPSDPPVADTAPSGDRRIDGLLSGVEWGGRTVTYTTPDRPVDYPAGYDSDENGDAASAQRQGFSPLSAVQLRAVHAVLDADPRAQLPGHAGFSVEGFTGLGTDFGPVGSGSGAIRLANSRDADTAYAFGPGADLYGGDVWFGPAGDAPVTGNYDHQTVIHEIGHALGLKHGNETGAWGVLPRQYDSLEFSVMTYRSFVGDRTSGYDFETWGAPQTFMALDIAALQHLYGADFTTRAGDTTYMWSRSDGATFVNGKLALDPGGNRIFQTIWDGGGTDRYDLSNYATDLELDLAPFGSSTFARDQLADLGGGPNGGRARGNVFNALKYHGDNRSLIENAAGGSGDDAIAGNGIANALSGNGGRDVLRGHGGNDRLRGGADADILIGGRGADVFDFDLSAQSRPGAGSRDTLRAGDGGDAFQGAGGKAGDRIDLSGLDADVTHRGNQSFHFGGAGLGEFALTDAGISSLVRANTDADRAFEFELEIEDGAVLASAYTAGDFIA